MKLLIDIPEHIYEHAKETTEDSNDEFDAMRAIANGIQQESRSENPNTCGDAISRQAVLDEIDRRFDLAKPFKQLIESMPSVTPQQRMGQWVKTISENGITSAVRCSECGFEDNRYMLFRYCPDCGAKMEVEE